MINYSLLLKTYEEEVSKGGESSIYDPPLKI